MYKINKTNTGYKCDETNKMSRHITCGIIEKMEGRTNQTQNKKNTNFIGNLLFNFIL